MAESESICSRILTHSCWKICAGIWSQKFWKIDHSCLKICGWNGHFFLESDRICAGRFVLESARKSSRIVSIRAWRFVAESEHVRGGILGHSWQKLKWLNPIRAWIRICSFGKELQYVVMIHLSSVFVFSKQPKVRYVVILCGYAATSMYKLPWAYHMNHDMMILNDTDITWIFSGLAGSQARLLQLSTQHLDHLL